MKEYVKIEDIKPYIQRAVDMVKANDAGIVDKEDFSSRTRRQWSGNAQDKVTVGEAFELYGLHSRDVTGFLNGTKKNGVGRTQKFVSANFFDKLTIMLDDPMAVHEVDYYNMRAGSEYVRVGE